jgi:hypothetical protein
MREEEERKTCGVCGKQSPATRTGYTLLSTQHGWRLDRMKLPDGKAVFEWNCPECWKAKRSKESGGTT